MKRTKLKDRILPPYTRGEEIFNMVSHIVGGAVGVAVCALCIVKSFLNGDAYQVTGSFIYGFSMILLYTISSVYHGLTGNIGKKVLQVIDHCSVFILISGTYTPIALSSLREYNTALGWVVFGVVWGVSALGITLNAIDLKKYTIFSMICYIIQGWCIIFTGKIAIEAIGSKGFMWLLLGGIAYTVGAVLYGIAGRGNQTSIMNKMIAELSLNDYIKYIGPIPYNDLPQVYSLLDLFVFPTELNESLGLVGLEAMACKVPVIGSNIGGLKDYIIPNYNGFFFNVGNYNDLANKIITYKSLSTEEKKIIENNAYKTALTYSSEKTKYDLYSKLNHII